MSKPKTRRKKGRPGRMPTIPLMSATRDEQSMTVYAEVETLCGAPSIDAYNAVVLRITTLNRVFGSADCIVAAHEVTTAVLKRFERTGVIGMTGDEMKALRMASGQMDVMLARATVNSLAASELKTARWCKLHGVAP